MQITRRESSLQDSLRQFSGGESRYRHPLSQIVYTEGVKYLAERAQAYWLIDLICSYQYEPAARACEPQFWTLQVREDHTAVAFLREDTNTPDIVRQEIPYTDFPLSEVRIWVCDGTMLLPSEY